MVRKTKLEKRKSKDLLINTASDALLVAQVAGGTLLEFVAENLSLAGNYDFENEMYPFPLNFTIGAGIAIVGSLIKQYNDTNQLSKICNNNPPMLEEGMHSLVRHPTYLCQRLISAGMALMFPNPAGIGGFLSHFGLSEDLARREEKTCELKYGNQHKEYKKETPRWVPNLSKLTNLVKKSWEAV